MPTPPRPQDPQPLRISGFRQAALAAAAHDHARVWLALRQAALSRNAPFEQLAAAVATVPAEELNFPPGEYLEDEALLVLLAACSRQQLEDHLEPQRLTKWYQDAQADMQESAGGSTAQATAATTSPLAAALAADSPAAAVVLAARGTAAPLRKDSSTQLVGVSHIGGSSHMAAAIQGGHGRGGIGAGGAASGEHAARPIGDWARCAAGPRHSDATPSALPLLPSRVRLQWTASARTWARLRAPWRRLWCGTWASSGSACTVRAGRLAALARHSLHGRACKCR